jgi:hypothetical protein
MLVRDRVLPGHPSATAISGRVDALAALSLPTEANVRSPP